MIQDLSKKYLDRMQRIEIKAQPRLKSEKPYPREYLVKLRKSPGEVRCCLQENISNSRAKKNVRAVRKNVCVKEKHDRAIKIGYIFGQRRTNKRTERCALNLMSRRGENNLGEHRELDGSSERI